MRNPVKFADLLRTGAYEIQRYESKQNKKPLKDIYGALGSAIDRKASTIDYYLRGNIPTSIHELEQLGREIFNRGGLDRVWLEDFLKCGDHPNPSGACDRLLTPTMSQIENQEIYQYKRTKMHVVRRMLSNHDSITETHIEVQSTAESGLESIRHRLLAIDMPMREKIKLEFHPGYRDGNGTMQERIMKNIPGIFYWLVEFKPPLKKHHRASYSYKQYVPNFQPWTYEECEEFIKSGEMTKSFANARFDMPTPVDEMYIKIEFPPYYPITLPPTGGFGVYFGSAEEANEKTRIIVERGFSARLNRTLQQWELELKANQVTVGFGYELQWLPPPKAKLSL